ncbi:glycosyltransferase involved in cell wall biosynthesis [Novosphingobium chloroacetimidivorans]|uniref:Glycosyltransferase involved in cell wall biosynthesis n=1 Tax=Novosphingobium chloroacetimidivorans TaxID=1428314 RepID=A0A7W7K700_9SPHN|nr:glycosyltransferase [Novosphingobium chloroacetimidivorans]MBB4857395.1 glycosyltransferase involved in cell wall biosynthesis [Novosphingobium chloroacetimidivorans]
MRILHVAESVKGGCGTYLNQVVASQLSDPAIHDLHVVVPDEHIVQVPDIPTAKRSLFASRGRSPASLLALWRATDQAVREFKPDCVHLHSTFAGAVGRIGLMLRAQRPPIVYCAHGWAFDMAGSIAKQRCVARVERWLSRRCEGVIAISDYERARGIEVGIAPERIVTVPNGIGDAPPPPPPECSPIRRVLFVGRLDRQKGVDVLLQAMRDLGGRVDLRVIGASVVGDEAPVLDQPGVTALGWCDQDRICRELAWADCVVVPSRWEGFGLVAVEAMRAGRAVVASDVGGLAQVVEHGRTGWLVPPEDPVALAMALVAPSDADLRAAGVAGRQRFLRHFTIDRTVTALRAVYRQAIAMRSSINHAFAHEFGEVGMAPLGARAERLPRMSSL